MAAPPQGLGVADAPLRFANLTSDPRRRLGRPCLTPDGEEAFELSFWCGTCPKTPALPTTGTVTSS